MMSARRFLFSVVALGAAWNCVAAIIGTNTPAEAVTHERIVALPVAQQSAWRAYLERSGKQRQADRSFLRRELEAHGLKETLIPPSGRTLGRGLLNQSAGWYASEEARRIADIVLSFQTPGGGWSKNLDMTRHTRAPGEHFNADNRSHYLAAGDYDTSIEDGWNYVGTFDNDATTVQMRYLARIIHALPSKESEAYQAAFERGLEYILSAQYPNGGWPQVWPLEGGYHDAITFNDSAMVHVLELLREAGAGEGHYQFVPRKLRARARESLKRGLECVLACQIVFEGRRTVWCQQHDALTMKPTSARNYEMPSQCSSESAGITLFLMSLSNPDPAVVTAVHAAAAWFEKTRIRGKAFKLAGGKGRQLVPDPGAGPIWPRFCELGTDRPIFGDRDKTIHDDVSEVSEERRRGYAWFGNSPQRVLDRYATWKSAYPPPTFR